MLIPVAAGALYWWDRLLLDPVLASAAMAMSSVSVVSNALRLRRFERPETAAAILQPKLSARIGDYAFLATVAAVALTLGTVFTWASRTETASHGMNGLLAWTEGMGMPMRPAMSVMETTDTPPISAHDAGLRVTLTPVGDLASGRPTVLRITIRDSHGNPVTDLVRTHQVWSHLILTRQDGSSLGTFAHIHPRPTGAPGQLRSPRPSRPRVGTSRTPRSDAGAPCQTCCTGPASPSPALRKRPRPRPTTAPTPGRPPAVA